MKIKNIFTFALLIAALLLAESRSVHNESTKFSKIGRKFYYIEEVEKLNWFAAAHKCIEFGGHLATLQSQKEHDKLKAHLNPYASYWIDINDLGREGQFLSLTTGREATYLNWEPYTNNPDNFQGKEDCGGLWNHNESFLMNDFACEDLMYFICEP